MASVVVFRKEGRLGFTSRNIFSGNHCLSGFAGLARTLGKVSRKQSSDRV